MNIFPRYQFDIDSKDLILGLLSYSLPLDKNSLEQSILKTWKKPHIKISFTVRTALDSFLTSLNLPKDSGVLMSRINILDMVKIIENHNLKVTSVDFRLDDLSVPIENIKKSITNKTKILIIAQLFGAIHDLEDIAKLCKEYNIILIEDCAQAFCGTKYYGSPYADISLFSFGVIKSTTALGGAIIVSKSQKHIDIMNKIESSYPTKSEFFFFKRLLKYLLLKIMLTPFIYGFLFKILKLLNHDIDNTINKFSKSFPKGDITSHIQFKPSLHLLFLLNRQLNQEKNDIKFQKREAIARDFIALLNNSIVIGNMAKHNSFWLIPILTKNPKKLQERLLAYGFDSTQGKQSQVAIHQHGNALTLVKKVLYLPTITKMSKNDKEKLAKLLNTFS